jgi:hypothetical protein
MNTTVPIAVTLYDKYCNFVDYLHQLGNAHWSDQALTTFDEVMKLISEHLPKEDPTWKKFLLPVKPFKGNLPLPPDLVRLASYSPTFTFTLFTQSIVELKRDQPRLAQLIVEKVGPIKSDEATKEQIYDSVLAVGLETIQEYCNYKGKDNLIESEEKLKEKFQVALDSLPDQELKPLFRLLRYLWLFISTVQVPEITIN